MLEENNVIGPADGAKPREVFVSEKEPNYEDPMTISRKGTNGRYRKRQK